VSLSNILFWGYYAAAMVDWIAFVLLSPYIAIVLCAVIWWIYLVVTAWRVPRRWTAALLLFCPIFAQTTLWFVSPPTFGLSIVLGVFISITHMVVKLWRRTYRKTAITVAVLVTFWMLSAVLVMILAPITVGDMAYSNFNAKETGKI
jgi:hypothetical protein